VFGSENTIEGFSVRHTKLHGLMPECCAVMIGKRLCNLVAAVS